MFFVRILACLFCFVGIQLASAEPINPKTVFDSSKFEQAQQLSKLLEQPENQIDFAKSKLAIDKMIDPSIDSEATLKQLDSIVITIKSMLPANASSMDKMMVIKKYLYQAGDWNNFQPYQYDFDDPLGTKISNKLLSTYLLTKKGNCVSMPLLFIILGQRMGIDVVASTAPNHVFVKFTDDKTNTTYNLETTSGANFNRDIWVQQVNRVTDEAIKNGIYLQKLTKQETVAVMADTLSEHYDGQKEFIKSMMIADVILKYYQKDVPMMLMKGHLFYQLLNKHYLRKYPSPNLIPEPERPFFEFVSINNRHWFEKAELLGWREQTPQQEQDYLNKMKQNATLMRNQ